MAWAGRAGVGRARESRTGRAGIGKAKLGRTAL